MNFGKAEREAGLGRWLTEAIRSVAECEGFFQDQLTRLNSERYLFAREPLSRANSVKLLAIFFWAVFSLCSKTSTRNGCSSFMRPSSCSGLTPYQGEPFCRVAATFSNLKSGSAGFLPESFIIQKVNFGEAKREAGLGRHSLFIINLAPQPLSGIKKATGQKQKNPGRSRGILTFSFSSGEKTSPRGRTPDSKNNRDQRQT